MKYRIGHAQDSDIGQKRDNNEDNYICLELPNRPELLVLGAIDGVGGYEGGEIAALDCKNTVEAFFSKHIKNIDKNPLQLSLQSLQTANNVIYHKRQDDENLSRMSCVASMALLNSENERLYFAHVGDSRGYVFRQGELIKFTQDHSMVGYLEEIGEITEEEAMAHPRRNQISKMMGEKLLKPDSSYIQSGEHSFYSNDIVLFCSDGLTDLVTQKEIIDILQQDIDLNQKKDALIALANAKGGKDNITVALASYTKGESKTIRDLEAGSTQINSTDDTLKQTEETLVLTTSPNTETEEEASAKTTTKKGRTWIYLSFLLLSVLGIVFFLNLDIIQAWYGNMYDNNTVEIDTVKKERVLSDTLYKEQEVKKEKLITQQEEQKLNGRWATNCEQSTNLNIDGDTVLIIVNSNHIYINGLIRKKNDTIYNVYLENPSDLGAGGLHLNWDEFSRDTLIASFNYKSKFEYLIFNWYGFYDVSSKKRVWETECDFQSEQISNIKFIKCD